MAHELWPPLLSSRSRAWHPNSHPQILRESQNSVVAWLYAELPGRWSRSRLVDWPGERDVTFSDAITSVRPWLWVEWVLTIPGHRGGFQKLAPGLRRILLTGLAQAA
jgi:hypothetical protein